MVGTILPLMRALFWTHTQIPTLSAILDPYDISIFKEWYWTATMKNERKDTINKEQEECEEILKDMRDLGGRILQSMVLGWKNSFSDDQVQPDWEDRLRIDKVAYSTEDLEFVNGLHSDILCFEAHRSDWKDGSKHVDRHLEGMQYKIRHPPMPQSMVLFHLCIRFQDYVRAKRAAGRDLWKEYLHGEDEFLEKGSTVEKEKVLS